MKNNKKLSIITICYNDPNLERTCESIINQTWQDFEWIVIDGGSNEETQKIWDKYKYRIDKFVSEPDTGVYNAMNKGIRLSEGRYLNFMNSGDAYCNNEILEGIFKNKNWNTDIIYGNEYYINFNNSPKYLRVMPPTVTKEHLIKSTIRHQSSFIKRKLFDEFGLYNEKYKIVSDWEKWIEFFVNKKTFTYINCAIADYDTTGSSFSQKTQDMHNKERTEVLHKYFTDKEISKVLHPEKFAKYSFLEQIFSVKNDNNNHKIITVLGIHIKIKRKNK